MINVTCLECNKVSGITVEGELRDYEGATIDCSHCGFGMIILNGEIKDFNKYLQSNYKSMGVEIDEEKDYTKGFIEI